jgi:dihydrofolate reductase
MPLFRPPDAEGFPREMKIILIAAMAENRVIGVDNHLPWDLPGERRRFRGETMGHPVIMGRKTFHSLLRPLDGRTVIVLSRRVDLTISGALLARSLQEALCLGADAPGGDLVFIAGGGEIYRQALPLAQGICLTVVHRDFQGNVTFPELPADRFMEICREDLPGSIPATLIRMERKSASA